MSLSALLFLIGLAIYVWSRSSKRPKRFSGRRHHALLLGLPMAQATGWGDEYLGREILHISPEGTAFLRPHLAYQIGCAVDAADEDIRRHLAQALESGWFRFDLDLEPGDDPRAALAFACVRTAFLVRTAHLLHWLDADTAWRVLLLNALRSQDCFSGWEDFGRAYAAGRAQWVGAYRADPLGGKFGEPELQGLLARPHGAWAKEPWANAAGFKVWPPREASTIR